MSACQLDNAAKTTDEHIALVLANREAAKPKFESYKFCNDCELEIPQERRDFAKGITRCFDCQDLYERKHGWTRK